MLFYLGAQFIEVAITARDTARRASLASQRFLKLDSALRAVLGCERTGEDFRIVE
jgi:hypothetical protein